MASEAGGSFTEREKQNENLLMSLSRDSAREPSKPLESEALNCSRSSERLDALSCRRLIGWLALGVEGALKSAFVLCSKLS